MDHFETPAIGWGDKQRGIRLWAAAHRLQASLGTDSGSMALISIEDGE